MRTNVPSLPDSSVWAEEKTALRRVATLVARGVPPADVFAAVTAEVVRLLPVDFARMGRYEPDGTLALLAASGRTDDHFPVGRRLTQGWNNLGRMVAQTGRSTRVDSAADSSALGDGSVREMGVCSAVATPVVVDGRLWGVIAAGSTHEQPLPMDSEARLASFTELVATTVANAVHHAELARLAEQQAALRRVATLVAAGVPPEEVFAAVIDEVCELFPVDYAGMASYDPDAMFTAVAARGTTHFPVGSSLVLGGKNTPTLVFETGRPARIDGYSDASGPIGDSARERGVYSSVAAPIMVEGRLWGAIGTGSLGNRPLPPDMEARLGDFTELVATAIANADSHAGLARLAEEQAALRRVATLVASGTPPGQLFAAVTEEVGRLLCVECAIMNRYEPDGTITTIAGWGDLLAGFSVGHRESLGGKNILTLVYQTGRPARMERYADSSSGSIGAIGRESGISSAVGAPIVVEDRLWGLLAVSSSKPEPPLSADTEARLASFTELVATAIANAESRAALATSRARIVAAADESRRRIERDLHDGAQERLVHAVIVLKLALRAQSNGDANTSELVAEALRHAEEANSELRELAHGILPEALTRGGLRAGVEELVHRVPLPVDASVFTGRLPASVEATAYFVVSEALTNVVKHARADRAAVTAHVDHELLRLEIRDDGVGGADSGEGSGLVGLSDRVEALGGILKLVSPSGEGTTLLIEIPVQVQSSASPPESWPR